MNGLLTSWKDPEAGLRKFYAALFMFQFSKVVDRKLYEAVTEGYLNLFDSDSPQVELVIYDKVNGYKPAIIIDFSFGSTNVDQIALLENLRKLYSIEEVFIFNIDKQQWMKLASAAEQSDFSSLLSIHLGKILETGLDLYRMERVA